MKSTSNNNSSGIGGLILLIVGLAIVGSLLGGNDDSNYSQGYERGYTSGTKDGNADGFYDGIQFARKKKKQQSLSEEIASIFH